MNYIIDNIFLGNFQDSKNLSALKSNNITHILTAGIDLERYYPAYFDYLYFPIYDSPYTNISKYFCTAIQFIIESQKKGKNILIHCAAGISRSTSFVIAYLIIVKKMTYTQAYLYVKNKRNIINPNEGFQKQLIDLSYNILGKA